MDDNRISKVTFNPKNIRNDSEREAKIKSDQVMKSVNDEIGRLKKADGKKDDLDKRPGHVNIDRVTGDAYSAQLDFDPKSGKAKGMKSEVDGGSVWVNEYDGGDAKSPVRFSREVISSLANEGDGPADMDAHRKSTVLQNKDGTISFVEEYKKEFQR